MSAPMSPPRIFLSYSHADKPWCRSFVAHLRSVLGYADPGYIFFDESSLQSGDTWLERLQQEVIARPVFILVLTPNAIASDYVRREVSLALRETISNRNRRIITVLLQPCDASQLAPLLMDYQMADFVHQPFNIAFTGLVGALRAINAEWMARNAATPPPNAGPASAPGYPSYPPATPASNPANPPAGQWAPQPMPQPTQPGAWPSQPLPQQPLPVNPPINPHPASPPINPNPAPPMYAAMTPASSTQAGGAGQFSQPSQEMQQSGERLQQINQDLAAIHEANNRLAQSIQAPTGQVGIASQSNPFGPSIQTTATSANAEMSPQLKKFLAEVHDSFTSQRWGDVTRRAEFALSLGEPVSDARFYRELATAYSELRRWEQCIEASRKSADLNPFYPKLWQTLALAQQQLGLMQDAITTWDYAVAMLPTGAITDAQRRDLLKQRRDALISQQLWDDVLANTAEEMRDGGGDTDMLRVRAEVLMRLKLNDETVTPYLQQWLPRWLQQLGFHITSIHGIEVIESPLCEVPAGAFQMGNDPDVDPLANADETPQHEVKLDTYQIGRFSVTVAEFARYVKAGGSPPAPYTISSGTVDWQKQLEHPEMPVVCVTWRDANAYAQWLAEITGKPWRLPTEAEWEKAARWDAATNHARIYPWGDTWDIARCHSNEGPVTGPLPVGMLPAGASPYGAQDMGGNVLEWCSSLYIRYPYSAKDGREAPDGALSRITRSGKTTSAKTARAAMRTLEYPNNFNKTLGFRLVCAPAPVTQSAASTTVSFSGILPDNPRVQPAPGGAGPAANVASAPATPLSPAQQLAQEAHLATRGGLWQEAIAKGEQAAQMPENAASETLFADLALAYGAVQRWDACVGAASQALRINGFNPDTWAMLARAQRMLGHANDALTSFNRALALTPADNRQMLGRLLEEQRTLLMEQLRWQDALAVLDEELRLKPGDATLLAARAELVRQLG